LSASKYPLPPIFHQNVLTEFWYCTWENDQKPVLIPHKTFFFLWTFFTSLRSCKLKINILHQGPLRTMYYIILLTNTTLLTADKGLRWSRGSVLAFRIQVRGFKPGRSRRNFQGEKKILNMYVDNRSRVTGQVFRKKNPKIFIWCTVINNIALWRQEERHLTEKWVKTA
jgi:hypothetical protein